MIGVQLSSAQRRRAGETLTGTPRNASYYDTKWKRQDTHKGATSCSTAQLHLLLYPLKFYQEDIVQRNNSRSYGIVLVRNGFSSLALGLSLWPYRDAGTTQMTRRHRQISTTH